MAARARARQIFYHFIICIDVPSYSWRRLRHHPLREVKLKVNAPQKRGLLARLPGAQSEKTPSLISLAGEYHQYPSDQRTSLKGMKDLQRPSTR